MKTYQAGIDVGSTTVKLVVLDENGQMIFGQYQRHLSHTQRALSDLLKQARAALGECALELRATGSGAINLAKALGIPFVQEVVAVAQALERVLILDDHRVLIAHGHTMGVKTGLLRAQYRALEQNADLLLFGHTHVPLVDAASRPMMMNPGSIGDPRRPTYGVLEFRDGQIYPSVFRLDA